MSNATELLSRALEAYDHKEEPCFERLHHAFEDIRAYLATEPEADEPTDIPTIAYQLGYQEGKKTRSLPAIRKPMTEEYIRILYGDDNNFELTAPYVIAFARAVERYHGIKKDDEFCDSHCTWLDHHPDCKQFIPKTEAKNPPLATAIGQAVKITENGDHIAYEIFDGDKWLRLEPAARKPMTEKEMLKGFGVADLAIKKLFMSGIRYAEKHHGITK